MNQWTLLATTQTDSGLSNYLGGFLTWLSIPIIVGFLIGLLIIIFWIRCWFVQGAVFRISDDINYIRNKMEQNETEDSEETGNTEEDETEDSEEIDETDDTTEDETEDTEEMRTTKNMAQKTNAIIEKIEKVKLPKY